MILLIGFSVLFVAAVTIAVINAVLYTKTHDYDTAMDSGLFMTAIIAAVIFGGIVLCIVISYNTAVVTIATFHLTLTPEQYMALDESGRTAIVGINNNVKLEVISQ